MLRCCATTGATGASCAAAAMYVMLSRQRLHLMVAAAQPAKRYRLFSNAPRARSPAPAVMRAHVSTRVMFCMLRMAPSKRVYREAAAERRDIAMRASMRALYMRL